MRPVDLLPAAQHPFFDQTFDTFTGAPLLIIAEFTWENAPGEAVYVYFRNGETWPPPAGLETPGNKPDALQPRVPHTTRFLGPANKIKLKDLGVVNRDNTGNLIINAQILRLQKDTDQKSFLKLRIVVPAGEASDLARAWQDGTWNGAAPPSIQDDIRTVVWKQVEFTRPVHPQDPPGTYCGYRGAIRDLEAALGGYCSYCEAKRQDSGTDDVEHRLPKASYQSEILRWDNFLLGCVACNQRFKGNSPDRHFGIENAIAAYHSGDGIVYPVPFKAPAAPDYNKSPVIPPGAGVVPYYEMRQVCNDYQIWPSVDDGGPGAPIAADANNPTNYSLLCFSYKLREFDRAGVPEKGFVPLADAVNLANSFIDDGPNDTVQAMVWDSKSKPPALRVMYVRVELDPRSPDTNNVPFDTRKLAAAHNTINMVGLNSIVQAFGDRRMLQRTHAWFKAIRSLQLLLNQSGRLNSWKISFAFRSIFGGAPSPEMTADQWNLVAENAEGGYYSVWLTVFKAHSEQDAITLAKTLNDRARAKTLYRYKGTNLANSVTNMIPKL